MSCTEIAQIHYEVRVLPDTHELDITMTLRGPVAQGAIQLEIPTWVPGDYSFAPYARDLFELHATDLASGQPLPVAREGWQGFRIDGGSGQVALHYRAYAYAVEFGEPSGIVDNEYAVLLGTRYLHVPAHQGACQVRYVLPPQWQHIHHPSGARPLPEHTWEYPSYEILLDTPVTMGRFDLFTRIVHGTPFYSVFVDRGVGFASGVEAFVDQLAAVADVFHQMFGAFPFADYTFVLTLNPDAEWGLEHLTSTMCGLGPDVFTVADETAHGVRVCAHELFHAWNVRRLRPSPLKHLSHQLGCGCFTQGLWVAEGFTRYYEFLACVRVGTYTPEQFFSSVVGYHQHLTAQPAYTRVSGDDSSLATYLNHSKYAGRVNNSIDYYDKGMLMAFDADASLRLSGAGTLDEVFASFYREYVDGPPGYPGYSNEDVYRHFDAALPGLGAQLAQGARRPGGLSTLAQLEALGFALHWQDSHRLGLVFLNGVSAKVYNVIDHSPAGASGLAPDDVLTAVNGYAFSPQALSWAASHAEPVTLDVERGHRHLRFTITPTPQRTLSALIWQGTPEQAQHISQWLQQPFAPVDGQRFSLDFYENFHGIETVL